MTFRERDSEAIAVDWVREREAAKKRGKGIILPGTADDAGLAKEAQLSNEDHRSVRFHLGSAVHYAIQAGLRLNNKVKPYLPHGQFLPWLKANCEFSERTAQTYMSMAYYVQMMPDLEDQLTGLPLGTAHRFLKDAFEKRSNSRARTIVEITKSLRDHVCRTQDELQAALDVLGEKKWEEWLSDMELDPKSARAFLKAGELIIEGMLYENEKGRPPLYLLPLPKDEDPWEGNDLSEDEPSEDEPSEDEPSENKDVE
ncbi:MAG TPA: DUF3102 domain-containing protein [Stellaceae bacterium]|nr:DUF3102 domain-containing protein [Stellaceae bacterium]